MGLLDNLAASVISFVKIVCFLFFAPVLYFTLPFIFLARGIPASDDFYQLLAGFYLVIGPFTCAFWFIILRGSRRHRQMEAEEGYYDPWTSESFWFGQRSLLIGFFGSAAAELIYVFLSRGSFTSTLGVTLWFLILPFATFSPVILFWVRTKLVKGNRSEEGQ